MQRYRVRMGCVSLEGERWLCRSCFYNCVDDVTGCLESRFQKDHRLFLDGGGWEDYLLERLECWEPVTLVELACLAELAEPGELPKLFERAKLVKQFIEKALREFFKKGLTDKANSAIYSDTNRQTAGGSE